MNKIYDSELLLSNLPEIIDNSVNKEDDNLHTKIRLQNYRFGIHLAIFVAPYLQHIIEGKKTVESRFSVNRIAPFKKIYQGDLILLKKSSGPIVGFCFVKDVWFYEINSSIWNDIRKNFGVALYIQDPQFWESKKHTRFATLIKLGEFKSISPIKFQKRDRRGWVILKPKESKKDKKNQIQLSKFIKGFHEKI